MRSWHVDVGETVLNSREIPTKFFRECTPASSPRSSSAPLPEVQTQIRDSIAAKYRCSTLDPGFDPTIFRPGQHSPSSQLSYHHSAFFYLRHRLRPEPRDLCPVQATIYHRSISQGRSMCCRTL